MNLLGNLSSVNLINSEGLMTELTQQFCQGSDGLKRRYQRAEALLRGVYSDQRLTRNTQLAARWIGETDCCWYRRETAIGTEYRLVDAAQASNQPAFDHAALAVALARVSEQAVAAHQLPISALA
ncbi:hypothetical protein N9537_06815, partial [Porticoccaceae bacterium]|nr:hypothetical protein [Porticoccaceae bacterium]